MIGVVMILSGFLGLLLADFGFIQHCRKYGKTKAQTYFNPAMLQSYVILILCVLILTGAFIGGHR